MGLFEIVSLMQNEYLVFLFLTVKGGLLMLDGEEELAGIKEQACKLPFLILKVRHPARN